MPSYKIIKPYNYGQGYLLDAANTKIPFSQLAPKVGETVTGELKRYYSFGGAGNGKGLSITKSVSGGQSTSFFIPEDSLQEVGKPAAASSSTGSKFFNAYTIIGPLAGMGIGYAIYRMQDKYSLNHLIAYVAVGGVLGMLGGHITASALKK